ncbi:hypothetical protein KFE98_15930 [bacterium SCSIO 12741]|nr:hypothetical protein KFE98_15930 [bacterium SCSIO 12741]
MYHLWGELKEKHTLHWQQPNTSAKNSTGFSGRGAGYHSGSGFTGLYQYAYFWSTSYNPSSISNRYYHYLSYNNDDMTYSSSASTTTRYSIRCVKNEVEANAGRDILDPSASTVTLGADSAVAPHKGNWTVLSGSGGAVSNGSEARSTFTGAPGNKYELEWAVSYQGDTARDTVVVNLAAANSGWVVGEDWLDTRDKDQYGTVQIGTQIWMTENMRYSTSNGSQYFYNNDSASYFQDYGRLYNFTAMLNGGSASTAAPSGVQGVCPTGWHVPSGAEWDTLATHLDASHVDGGNCSTCGGDLKDHYTVHWDPPNTSATNSTGFTAVGNGQRSSSSSFTGIYDNAYIWSASLWPSSSNGRIYYLSYNDNQLRTSGISTATGGAVRCVKD